MEHSGRQRFGIVGRVSRRRKRGGDRIGQWPLDPRRADGRGISLPLSRSGSAARRARDLSNARVIWASRCCPRRWCQVHVLDNSSHRRQAYHSRSGDFACAAERCFAESDERPRASTFGTDGAPLAAANLVPARQRVEQVEAILFFLEACGAGMARQKCVHLRRFGQMPGRSHPPRPIDVRSGTDAATFCERNSR
jgi:hypothetical protein